MTPRQICDDLQALLAPLGFTLRNFDGPSPSAMGAWCVDFRTDELMVTASQDRAGDATHICIGSLLRRAPRKHMRGPWSLAHLRGFVDQAPTHYRFATVNDQLNWLRQNATRILDSGLLNSDEMNDWAVAASRLLFPSAPQDGE